MAVSALSLFLAVPCVGLQCVIVVFPIHTYLLFRNDILTPYNLSYKELSKSYTILKAVIYVTYCHTNNKKMVNTRNDVGFSIFLLNFNIMLLNDV